VRRARREVVIILGRGLFRQAFELIDWPLQKRLKELASTPFWWPEGRGEVLAAPRKRRKTEKGKNVGHLKLCIKKGGGLSFL